MAKGLVRKKIQVHRKGRTITQTRLVRQDQGVKITLHAAGPSQSRGARVGAVIGGLLGGTVGSVGGGVAGGAVRHSQMMGALMGHRGSVGTGLNNPHEMFRNMASHRTGMVAAHYGSGVVLGGAVGGTAGALGGAAIGRAIGARIGAAIDRKGNRRQGLASMSGHWGGAPRAHPEKNRKQPDLHPEILRGYQERHKIAAGANHGSGAVTPPASIPYNGGLKAMNISFKPTRSQWRTSPAVMNVGSDHSAYAHAMGAGRASGTAKPTHDLWRHTNHKDGQGLLDAIHGTSRVLDAGASRTRARDLATAFGSPATHTSSGYTANPGTTPRLLPRDKGQIGGW